jgi:hypothetical protein
MLRMLPMLFGQASHSEQTLFIPALFVPEEQLQYAAMIRQDSLLLSNPYVCDPQEPRFILLYHSALSVLHRVTGFSPLLLLELSRIPLLFIFFALWWRMVELALSSARAQFWAILLTAFGGGLDFIPWAAAPFFSPQTEQIIYSDVSPYNGWSFFGQSFNTLWLVAWCLALPVLQALIWPEGPKNIRTAVVVFACQLLLCFVHPYTAFWVYLFALLFFIVSIIVKRPGPAPTVMVALFLSALIAGGITLWQLQDAVFRTSASGMLGDRKVWAWWYPCTLGGVGWLAWRGYKLWKTTDHPWRLGVLCWVLMAAVLHQLPGINGYKFIPALFLPLVLLAADPLAALFKEWHTSARWKSAALILLFFSSTPMSAARSISPEELSGSQFSRDSWYIVLWFQSEPQGNVLAGGETALLLPAFSNHRVYAGHRFSTPNYNEKMAQLKEWWRKPLEHLDDFDKLIKEQRIRYVFMPTRDAKKIEDRVFWKHVVGTQDWAVFQVSQPEDALKQYSPVITP